MLKLGLDIQGWRNDGFAAALAREIEGVHQEALPLHRALTQGGRIVDDNMTVTVLGTADAGEHIEAKIGVMFVEALGGCSCGDELVESPQYCELRLRIDKSSGDTQVDLIAD